MALYVRLFHSHSVFRSSATSPIANTICVNLENVFDTLLLKGFSSKLPYYLFELDSERRFAGICRIFKRDVYFM